jgi:hypothetical protein
MLYLATQKIFKKKNPNPKDALTQNPWELAK